jgi:hypothetical protein
MAKTYNLKAVVLTIGGVGISGYGATDAIGFEWLADIHERFVSADGKSVFVPTNDRALDVTVTVHQRSRAYLLLQDLLRTQTGEIIGVPMSVIPPCAFYLLDRSNGETIVSPDAVFMSRPAPSKGKTLGEVAFRLCLPEPMIGSAILNLI